MTHQSPRIRQEKRPLEIAVDVADLEDVVDQEAVEVSEAAVGVAVEEGSRQF
jgi:hypothetical protein